MKKKDKKSCIIVGERKCEKIGSDLFYNMDMSLAIVIRDMLYEFAETEALASCPTYYTLDEEGNETMTMKKACKAWSKEVRRVGALFDKYIEEGFGPGEQCHENAEIMFEELAKIFPALWI